MGDEPQQWSELKARHEWTGLLLGNGASRAVWQGFAYESLYETARSPDIAHALDNEDGALFEEFETTNFERILAVLSTTYRVASRLQLDLDVIRRRHGHIRTSLVEAVHARHVPWTRVGPVLKALRAALREYQSVYTTNYDLLPYWAAMHGEEDGDGFVDFFFDLNHFFDPDDTDVREGSTTRTRLYFLHGALHLNRVRDGRTRKRTYGSSGALLDTFGDDLRPGGSVPLIVVEGSAKDKLAAIRRSDYLRFSLGALSHHSGPMVIFGHSLSAADHHIVQALQRMSPTAIAVSIRPGSNEAQARRMAELRAVLFGAHDLYFFDSSSHPLGASKLRVLP